ncbi:hypothetical protein F4560_004422 [Saccharothrix ecbatanensis]|uniref:Uncharacterized protein n=1 Tax=Saccharothrix ecbatanensis TaxID=1105145 RepID=A0A7W9HMT6_9PSEU|nr:hypothetical protein [Saccharothrix ecbatanensis]MBB5804654.1 hypothetical protein [Saccharothrix ecbatanensis]
MTEGHEVYEFDNGFNFSFGWGDLVTIGDIIHFEKVRNHPYDDLFTGIPKKEVKDDGSWSYVTDEFGNIVREHTKELSAEFIWILARTQDKSWTYDQTLALPGLVLYKLFAELAKRQLEAMEEDKKSEPSKDGEKKKRNPRKKPESDTDGKA